MLAKHIILALYSLSMLLAVLTFGLVAEGVGVDSFNFVLAWGVLASAYLLCCLLIYSDMIAKIKPILMWATLGFGVIALVAGIVGAVKSNEEMCFTFFGTSNCVKPFKDDGIQAGVAFAFLLSFSLIGTFVYHFKFEPRSTASESTPSPATNDEV